MKRLLLILPLLALSLAACKKDKEPEPTPELLILGKWQREKVENIAVLPDGVLAEKETTTYGKSYFTFDEEGTLSLSGYGACLCPIDGSGEYRVEELEGKPVLIRGRDWYADTVRITTLDSKNMVWEKSRELGEHYHENFPGRKVWYTKDTHKQITTFTRAKE